MQPPFSILEHPADLGIEGRGATLAEAFQNAAVGLMSIIFDPTTVDTGDRREITLTAPDRERLLVRWLSEILYLYDGQGFVCKEFTIHHLTTTTVKADVRGEMFDPAKHTTRSDVKAVTYHQLVVREDNQGGLVRVFLDV